MIVAHSLPLTYIGQLRDQLTYIDKTASASKVRRAHHARLNLAVCSTLLQGFCSEPVAAIWMLVESCGRGALPENLQLPGGSPVGLQWRETGGIGSRSVSRLLLAIRGSAFVNIVPGLGVRWTFVQIDTYILWVLARACRPEK